MRIKFIKQGANSAIGGFSIGDIFACGDALGRHLVEEAKVAEYLEPIQASERSAEPDAAATKSPRARKLK